MANALKTLHFALILVFFILLPAREASAGPAWLHSQGNQIVDANGVPWIGRGANIMDASNNRRAVQNGVLQTDPNRALKFLDNLLNGAGANFIRIPMESTGNPNSISRILQDQNYWSGIISLVNAVENSNRAYVILAPWHDPNVPDSTGIPNDSAYPIYQKMVDTFHGYSSVIYGICNEPTYAVNNNVVRAAMSSAIQTIRARETQYTSPQHLIAVQGFHFASDVNEYLSNPISSGSPNGIVYEVHIYDYNIGLNAMAAASKIPVVVGEYGPSYDGNNSANGPNDCLRCGKDDPSLRLSLPQILPMLYQFRERKMSYMAWSASDGARPVMYTSPTDPNCPLTFSTSTPIPPLSSFGNLVIRDLLDPVIPARRRAALKLLLE